MTSIEDAASLQSNYPIEDKPSAATQPGTGHSKPKRQVTCRCPR